MEQTHWQVWLYIAAVLIPLAAFAVQVLGMRWLGRLNAFLATGAIVASCVLSLVGFVSYLVASNGMPVPEHAEPESLDLEEARAEGPTARIVPVVLQTEAGHDSTEAVEPSHADGGGEHGHAAEPVSWSRSWTWVALGGNLIPGGSPLELRLGVHIDNLAVIMFVMVSFIASLIHLYSMSYMADDTRYPRFFAYLSLFCFSMLGLVASSNVFMVFIFWELVGVCSYLLIGFWYEEKVNSDAANKAFITNRIGDVGMLIGLGLIWTQLGTFNIDAINDGLAAVEARQADALGRIVSDDPGHVMMVEIEGVERAVPHYLLVLAGLGIFAGCVGKSAQFPLHVWLPDAMAGPTPVSALIHAATMVAAGVYLVGRFFPLFTSEVLLIIAYAGGITLFIAASIAMVQVDYKKVLAYSTVSQLGFMMLALGVGGWAAGLFHLLTHAFFKALLFLGAGSIHHAVHTYDLRPLGGLRKKMPITATTMLLATLAISGVPFFSGFYSKDAILAAAVRFVSYHPGHALLLILPCVGAAMTAFYMFRMWFLVFTGEPRGWPSVLPEAHAPAHGHEHGHDNPVEHAHESGPLITWVLILLAIPTVAIGWPITIIPFLAHPILEDWLAYGEPLTAQPLGSAHLWAVGASILVLAIGVAVAFLMYHPDKTIRRINPARMAHHFGGLYTFLVNKWYFDEVYWALLVRPCLSLARAAAWFDRTVIDGIVDGSARVTVGLSRIDGIFDARVVDWIVNAVGRITYVLGDWSRAIQTGRLRGYLMVLSLAVVLLSAGVFVWIVR